MKYDIEAKRTMYNGVQFRSRLEAKWACFFDLIGWKWTYEPCELNGYNPDFIIQCTGDQYGTNTMIVEVKPNVFLTEKEKIKFSKKYESINAHFLILTESPFYLSDYDCLSIGIGYQSTCNDGDLYDIEMKSLNEIGSNYMIFDGMIYGDIERKSFVYKNDSLAMDIYSKWIEAGNVVMFEVNKNK